jgi:hypothetical protein
MPRLNLKDSALKGETSWLGAKRRRSGPFESNSGRGLVQGMSCPTTAAGPGNARNPLIFSPSEESRSPSDRVTRADS